MDRHVLSIQSHVVRGFVGNKCATFALQLFGVEVDPLNVLQFSNHGGYPVVKGRRHSADELRQVIEGLTVQNLLVDYGAVITGYVGDPATLRLVREVVERITVQVNGEKSRPLLYLCDPVLGDDGKLYVSPDAVAVYQEELCTIAHVMTPNGFEAETLSGVAVNDVASAKKAAAWFHSKGVLHVVITSFANHTGDAAGDEQISYFTSESVEGGRQRQFVGSVPKVRGKFSGTGDLFAAILLARLLEGSSDALDPFHICVHKAMCTVLGIVEATRAKRQNDETFTELEIVSAQHLIRSPNEAAVPSPIEV